MNHQYRQVYKKSHKDPGFRRVNKMTVLFNSHELKAFEKYCHRFGVRNKSRFMRETIITAILEKFDSHYPSLFDDQPTLFS